MPKPTTSGKNWLPTESRSRTAPTGPPAGSVDDSEKLYGLRVVTEALRAGSRTFIKILITHRDRQFTPIVQMAKSQGVPVLVEPCDHLNRLVPQGHHQGVVGLVASRAYSSEEEVLKHSWDQPASPFLLAFDGVEDPQNLGAAIRTAEVAGVHGIFLPERRSVGLTAGVARASAGALEHIRIARTTNIGKLVERMDTSGVLTVAFDSKADVLYTTCDFSQPVMLVFGGEGKGLRPGVQNKCREHVRIPVRGRIQSLNVSASVAAAVFEVVRQRMQQREEGPERLLDVDQTILNRRIE